jgi:hypothetical protein
MRCLKYSYRIAIDVRSFPILITSLGISNRRKLVDINTGKNFCKACKSINCHYFWHTEFIYDEYSGTNMYYCPGFNFNLGIII